MMNADDSHPTLVVHKESAVQVVLNDEIVSDSDTNNSKDTLLEDPTWVQRQAMRVARNPCMFFWISFILALGLGKTPPPLDALLDPLFLIRIKLAISSFHRSDWNDYWRL